MKNLKLLFVLIAAILFTFTSCKKEPGEGGNSTIIGRVKVLDYDYGYYDGKCRWVKTREYYAPDERVYIIYGEDTIHSDDFRTNPDGYYRFEWLQKGIYTIFVYSDDTIQTSLNISNCTTYNEMVLPVKVNIEIKKNKEEVIAQEIVIIN
ncbi:hypothetical protein JYU16_01630 [bacterium AH-315-M05]|nr:hypothetical protein [bacterium AH-315-M05]